MADEEKGKKIHVPTKEGKYDLHYEGTGEFAPKDGGETYDLEKDEYKSSEVTDDDTFDAESLFKSMKLDEDLEDFDTSFFDDMILDDDLEGLDDFEQIDIEERLSNSVTLKNYRKTRAERVSKMKPRWSARLAMKFRDKMREILPHTTVISRIPEEKLLRLIESGEYMNQFGAGGSEGYFAGTSKDGGGRGRMTRDCFGTEIAGTTMEDRKKWEKYGTLCPDGDFDSIIDKEDRAGSYGSIACIYKKDKIKGLATFTLSDSLGYDYKSPVLFEDDADEFCMEPYEASKVTEEKLAECKNINDVVRMVNSYSYGEAQIHVDKITMDYFDAIAIPYSTLNGYASSSIKKAIKLAQEKYPDLKFTSRDKSGRPRVITIGEDGEYVWGDIYKMPK